MAEASTARYKNNEPLSVFDGIPVTAKDEIRVVSRVIHTEIKSLRFIMAPMSVFLLIQYPSLLRLTSVFYTFELLFVAWLTSESKQYCLCHLSRSFLRSI